MGSVNKVILIGNLGADPEVKYTAGGMAVANLRLATTDRFKDKDGNAQEKTEWHRVTVWDRSAEHCKQYLAKGRQVYIEGSLETRKWTDKEGVERYTTEIRARQVTFLGGKEQGQGGGQASGGGWGGGQEHRPAQSGGGVWGDQGGRSQAPARSAQSADDEWADVSGPGLADEDLPF